MAGIVIINRHIQYQVGYVIHGLLAGEEKLYAFIQQHFASHIIEDYFKDGTFTIKKISQIEADTQPQIETVAEIMPVENQEITQQEQVFETVYSVREPLQDKDGNEIAVDTRLTAKELKDKFEKGQKTKLLKEGKLMAIKIVK